MARLLLLFGSLAVSAQALQSGEHPLEKVIGLLQELAAKSETESKQEEVSYTRFAYWCQTSFKSLGTSITSGKATLDELSSTLESHKKNIEVLGKEIDALTQDLQNLDVTKGGIVSQRTDGSALYAKEEQTLKDTIQGISDALAALTAAKGNVELLQQAKRNVAAVSALVGATATAAQRAALRAFAEQEPMEGGQVRPDLKAAGDIDDHVKKYSFKSNSVVELLKELKMKFEDELVASTKGETNALNSHSLALLAHDNLAKAKAAAKADKGSQKADAEGELNDAQTLFTSTSDDVDADSTSLSDTQSACSIKKAEWAERTDTRAKEKESLKAAVEILAKVGGVRTEAPSNPVPPPSPVAFLQLRASNPKTRKAIQLLRSEAKQMHSKVLEKLAETVESHDQGPFDQVVNMIQKMIFQLANEQKEEDEHKAWCDLEEQKTNTSINDKQSKIEELTAKIDEAQARVALLAADISDSNDMVAKITSHVEEATEIRQTGKQENALAAKDAADAQKALANAVAVLQDFYKSSGAMKKEAWEFIQHKGKEPIQLPETPSTWDSGYTGVADPAKQPEGIVTVLETISADFAKMQSQTNAQESSDQEAFEEEMKSCAIEKSRRTKEAEMKSQEKKRVTEKLASMTASRKSVAGEKEATEQYLKDLAPACFDGSSTYVERKEARDKEIVSLKEAQVLLQEGALAVGDVCYRFCEDGSEPSVDLRGRCPADAPCASPLPSGTMSFDTCGDRAHTCSSVAPQDAGFLARRKGQSSQQVLVAK